MRRTFDEDGGAGEDVLVAVCDLFDFAWEDVVAGNLVDVPFPVLEEKEAILVIVTDIARDKPFRAILVVMERLFVIRRVEIAKANGWRGNHDGSDLVWSEVAVEIVSFRNAESYAIEGLSDGAFPVFPERVDEVDRDCLRQAIAFQKAVGASFLLHSFIEAVEEPFLRLVGADEGGEEVSELLSGKALRLHQLVDHVGDGQKDVEPVLLYLAYDFLSRIVDHEGGGGLVGKRGMDSHRKAEAMEDGKDADHGMAPAGEAENLLALVGDEVDAVLGAEDRLALARRSAGAKKEASSVGLLVDGKVFLSIVKTMEVTGLVDLLQFLAVEDLEALLDDGVEVGIGAQEIGMLGKVFDVGIVSIEDIEDEKIGALCFLERFPEDLPRKEGMKKAHCRADLA